MALASSLSAATATPSTSASRQPRRSFAPSLRKIEHLSQYATSFRYPVSSSSTKRIPRAPAPSELRAALDDTAAALDLAAKAFKVDLSASTAAGFAGPIRVA